jgi:hypothetical protein
MSASQAISVEGGYSAQQPTGSGDNHHNGRTIPRTGEHAARAHTRTAKPEVPNPAESLAFDLPLRDRLMSNGACADGSTSVREQSCP